jgi:hypothetical protein
MVGPVLPGFANIGIPADCLRTPFRNRLHFMGRLQPGAGASRLIASQLFELKPWDPITFLGACLMMTAGMMAAGYSPARRAAAIDPMRVLRAD